MAVNGAVIRGGTVRSDNFTEGRELFQHIEQHLDQVRARAVVDLREIVNDESVTREGLIRCVRAANDFENVVDEILSTAWIPSDLRGLTTSIHCMIENTRMVRGDIDAALDVVFDEYYPDVAFRIWAACNMER